MPQTITNIPRCLPQILTVLEFWYHLAHSFSRKKCPFWLWEGFLRGWGRPPKAKRDIFWRRNDMHWQKSAQSSEIFVSYRGICQSVGVTSRKIFFLDKIGVHHKACVKRGAGRRAPVESSLPVPSSSSSSAAVLEVQQTSEVAKIKRDRALVDLESGSFEPKSFTSSATTKKKNAADDEGPVVVTDAFAFGRVVFKITFAVLARSTWIWTVTVSNYCR